MINSSVYINDDKLIVPERLLVFLHSQLKLKAIEHTSYKSWDSISDYLEAYYASEFKVKYSSLFHLYNSYGIGIKSASVERAIRGKKGSQKVNFNTEVSYELLDFLCYASWDKSLTEMIFDNENDWGNKTIYSVTMPEYAMISGSIKNKSNVAIEKTNPEIQLFAHRIYIELTTRKAAIPIDEDNDLIEEIYNSWYKLFCIIRDEMKTIPITCFNDERSQPVIILATKILNEALRPHLTEHQAKYRDWLAKAKQNPTNKNIAPQDLQKKYPDYSFLITSMKQVNKMLIEGAEKFYRFLF